ncbi:unnamed protein product, partial [Heterobilharzia americana]
MMFGKRMLLIHLRSTEISLYFYLLFWACIIQFSTSLVCNTFDHLEYLFPGEYEKVVAENQSYRQSDHYYYTQTVRLNQTPPLKFARFNKTMVSTTRPLRILSLFPIKFHGIHYQSVEVYPQGDIGVGEKLRHLGTLRSIHCFPGGDEEGVVETIVTNNVLAVRWPNMSVFKTNSSEVTGN